MRERRLASRLAGIATAVCCLSGITLGASVYLNTPSEQRRVITHALSRYKLTTPTAIAIDRTTLRCLPIIIRRPNRSRIGAISGNRCVAENDVNPNLVWGIIAHMVMEEAARSKL